MYWRSGMPGAAPLPCGSTHPQRMESRIMHSRPYLVNYGPVICQRHSLIHKGGACTHVSCISCTAHAGQADVTAAHALQVRVLEALGSHLAWRSSSMVVSLSMLGFGDLPR